MIRTDRLGHQSLKELVVHRIRKAILDGELLLGSRLTETTVAEQLGVSRGPVREAFQDLAREGLLEINPRRGAAVCTLSPDDIWQIYTLRAHLEALLVRHGLQRFTPEDFHFLAEIVQAMGSLADKPGEVIRATDLDHAFHGRIAGRCPYPRMVEAYRSLDAMVAAGIYTVVQVQQRTMARMQAKHQAVLDALRGGEGATAEAAVQAHWIDTAEHIRRTMQRKQQEPGSAPKAAGAQPSS